jgi:SAM-dependent methyltransferase
MPLTKDIIPNRTRLDLPTKLKLAIILLRENGIVWSLLMASYYVMGAIAHASFEKAILLRNKRRLPGLNSTVTNKQIWEHWDWSGQGEEWTPSIDWKDSVIRCFLDPLFTGLTLVLEIGPGAGRWTEHLIERSSNLIGVDLCEASVRLCECRFRHHHHARFEVGSGEDLASIESESVDGIWSFDVFVHINKLQFKAYAREFARVLKPGGIGLIQHGSVGGLEGGWRSDVSNADVREFLTSNGLLLERQVQGWEDGGRVFEAGLYRDTITCFRKPINFNRP